LAVFIRAEISKILFSNRRDGTDPAIRWAPESENTVSRCFRLIVNGIFIILLIWNTSSGRYEVSAATVKDSEDVAAVVQTESSELLLEGIENFARFKAVVTDNVREVLHNTMASIVD
jgi:hypothetical protein